MKGIWFGNKHSYDDLNLVLSSMDIPPATPKTTFVDIPGGDGSVDLTEATGEVRFNDRECSFVFTVFPTDDFEVKKREVSNLINGQRMRIKVDKDPGYYWDGRCSVDEYASDKNLHQITIGATVKPYKLKDAETVVTVLGDGVVTLPCARKTVVPTITATGSTKVVLTSKNVLDASTAAEYGTTRGTVAYNNGQVTITSGTSGASVKFNDTKLIPLVPGAEYTVSFSAKASDALTMGYNYFTYINGASTRRSMGKTFNVTTNWSNFSHTFTAPTDAGSTFSCAIVLGTTAKDITLYLKNLQIEEGSGSAYEAYTEKSTVTISAGTHKVLDLQLTDGDHHVIVDQTMLSRPYWSETSNPVEINGVTFTAQSDGSIKANGTATANTYYRLTYNTSGTQGNSAFMLGAGDYVASGGVSANQAVAVYLYPDTTTSSTYTASYISNGNDRSFTLDTPMYACISVFIAEYETVDNVIFKPTLIGTTKFTYQEGDL